MEFKIVKNNNVGYINYTGQKDTYFVISEPINETGICIEFNTIGEAKEFINSNEDRFFS